MDDRTDKYVAMDDRARGRYVDEVLAMLVPIADKVKAIIEWNEEYRFLKLDELENLTAIWENLARFVDDLKLSSGELGAARSVAMVVDKLSKTANELDDRGAHGAAEKIDNILQKYARELQVQNIGETGVPAPAGQQVSPQSSKQVIDMLKKEQPKISPEEEYKGVKGRLEAMFYRLVGEQEGGYRFGMYVERGADGTPFLRLVGGSPKSMGTIGSPVPFKDEAHGAKLVEMLANKVKAHILKQWKKSMGSVDTLKILAEIASDLDDKGAHKQASELDDVIKKMSQDEEVKSQFGHMAGGKRMEDYKLQKDLFRPEGRKSYFPKREVSVGNLLVEYRKTLTMLGFNKQQAANYKLRMFTTQDPNSVVLKVMHGVGMSAKPVWTSGVIKKTDAANKVDEAAAETLTHFESRMARK
jgi:hypothetical protein